MTMYTNANGLYEAWQAALQHLNHCEAENARLKVTIEKSDIARQTMGHQILNLNKGIAALTKENLDLKEMLKDTEDYNHDLCINDAQLRAQLDYQAKRILKLEDEVKTASRGLKIDKDRIKMLEGKVRFATHIAQNLINYCGDI